MHRLRDLCFVIAVFGVVALAWGQGQRYLREFSADNVSSIAGHETTSRFYAGKSRTRTEHIRDGEVTSVTIVDMEKQTAWRLNPQRKTAMDMSAMFKTGQAIASQMLTGAPFDPNDPCASLRNSKCHKLGAESMNGRQTQKWEVTDDSGKTMTVWIDASLPLAVKSMWSGGSGEFRNIKEAPQPGSLFEVPADYRKIASPLSAAAPKP